MSTWYHYGNNGSGLPLHCRVVVDEIVGGRAKVRFTDGGPALDRLGGEVQEGDGRWVDADRLTDDPAATDPDSLNWLD